MRFIFIVLLVLSLLIPVQSSAGILYKNLPTPKTLETRFQTLSTSINTRGALIGARMDDMKLLGFEPMSCYTAFVPAKNKAIEAWNGLNTIVEYYKLFQDEEAFERYEHYEKTYKTHVNDAYKKLENCLDQIEKAQKTLIGDLVL